MINFLKYKWFYFLISSFFLIPGLYSLFRWKVRPSIDFTGGTILEVRLKENSKFQIPNSKLKEVVEKKEIEVSSIQPSDKNTYLLRMGPMTKEKKEEVLKVLREKFGSIQEVRFETVGPTLGRELLKKTFCAALFSVLGILFFIAWSFRNWRFGLAAILALLHDFFLLLGCFSLLGHFLKVEVDSLFVTASLTTMSFSVHDTIVIFDRIRERRKLSPRLPLETQANIALTETMVRSLNNSFTIIFMLLSFILLGGETIKWFVVALLIGTIAGTYSSPFVATPILILLYRLRKK